MKPGTALLTLVAIAGLAAPPRPAMAAITSEQGAICKPYGMNYGGSFFSNGLQLSNVSSAAGEVLCPVIRAQEVGPGGLRLYVDGSVGAGATLTCWLMSYDYSGNLLGTVAGLVYGPATFDRLLVLPQSQVPMWSSQVVDCVLPPGAAIFDIDPSY